MWNLYYQQVLFTHLYLYDYIYTVDAEEYEEGNDETDYLDAVGIQPSGGKLVN